MFWVVAVVFLAVALVLFLLSSFIAPKPIVLNGAHVLVTGGSSGIGKCLAVEAAKRGASVTLLARNKARLAEAVEEVQKYITDGSKQKVQSVSADISKDFSLLEETVKQIEAEQGPITALINCAGTSMSGKFLETPLEDFKRMMDINYHGSVLLTRAVLPGMVARRQGRVVFVSSMAGQLGLFGYTAYSSSKFALRGLAESLQMEVKPHNIQVTLAFPPDTDTPGFAEEQKSKPRETRLLSESGGLFQPDVVARTIIQDMVKGRFLSSVGVDGFMLSTVTSGFSPVTSLLDAILQVSLMGIFRLVCLFYQFHFDRTVKKCQVEGEADKGDKKSS
ncbi:3-dehydrosphinganine reductase-like [Babylonia areolata]|uniref:3-dehydrosphinganine reductase-like n=1 Tax=Babylonia areolata TaxID=304850 RepID=UPI003FD585B9